jgi:FAD/FMN-containing dehydrogenase
VSAAVVLPSGESVTASADEHPDLFWALRGGGGNLGVVTSLVFRTFPVADRDVATLVFPDGATAQAVFGWYEWLRTADRAIWGMVNITADAGSQRCTIVLATPAGDGNNRAGDLSAAIGVQPVSTTTRTLDRMDFVHYFEGGPQATQPRSFIAGSDIIGEMTQAAADSIVNATSAWPRDAGSATAVIESLSGAVADAGPGDTAFPWRRQAACVQWYTEPPTPQEVETATAWLADAHAAVQTHSVGGYVNYVEVSTPASRYFGDNTDRLSAIRRKYDPAGLMYSAM